MAPPCASPGRCRSRRRWSSCSPPRPSPPAGRWSSGSSTRSCPSTTSPTGPSSGPGASPPTPRWPCRRRRRASSGGWPPPTRRRRYRIESELAGRIFSERGRQGGSEGVRREAGPGVAGPVTIDPRTPCLIGAAQRTVHPGTGPSPEPLELWADVARRAADDALPGGGARVLRSAESLQVVYCMSWPYDAPADRLAAALGIEPGHRLYSGIGGTTPQVLVQDVATAMLGGEMDLAVIVGAEALETKRQAKKAGERLAWSHRDPEPPPFPFEAPFHPAEVAHQVFQAWLTFPVFDIARRARLGTAPASYAPRGGGAARALQRGGGREPLRLVPDPAVRRRAGHPHPGEPHGRLPVHEAVGVDHGRRHGGGPRRGHPRPGRRARRPRRPPGLPAGVVLRDGPGVPGRAPRPLVLARHGVRRRPRRSSAPGSASTTSPTSTCTAASPAPCTWPATRSASARATGAASR